MQRSAKISFLFSHRCQVYFDRAIFVELRQIAKNVIDNFVVLTRTFVGHRQGDLWEMQGRPGNLLGFHAQPFLTKCGTLALTPNSPPAPKLIWRHDRIEPYRMDPVIDTR